MNLSYKDRQEFVHDLRVLGRSEQQGFYRFLSISAAKGLLLHASLVTMEHGANKCRATPEFLDALLAREPELVTGDLWHTWRQSGPTLGRPLLLRKSDGSTLTDTVTSGVQIDSLIQMGYVEWRYL